MTIGAWVYLWAFYPVPLISINRGIGKEDVVHIYSGTLLSHKKNKIMPFAAMWIDIEIVILSELSQTEKDKYHMISLICGT